MKKFLIIFSGIITIAAFTLFLYAENKVVSNDILLSNVEALCTPGELPSGAIIGASMAAKSVEVGHTSGCWKFGVGGDSDGKVLVCIEYQTGQKHYQRIDCCVTNNNNANACDPSGEHELCAYNRQ